MGIEKKIKEVYKNKSFILASGTYLLSSLVDYISTDYGISINKIQEINSIYEKSIECFGVSWGC